MLPEWIEFAEAVALLSIAPPQARDISRQGGTLLYLPGLSQHAADRAQRGKGCWGGGGGGGGRGGGGEGGDAKGGVPGAWAFEVEDGGGAGRDVGAELMRRIEPAIMLFLRQLRRVTIDDRVRGCFRRLTLRPLDEDAGPAAHEPAVSQKTAMAAGGEEPLAPAVQSLFAMFGGVGPGGSAERARGFGVDESGSGGRVDIALPPLPAVGVHHVEEGTVRGGAGAARAVDLEGGGGAATRHVADARLGRGPVGEDISIRVMQVDDEMRNFRSYIATGAAGRLRPAQAETKSQVFETKVCHEFLCVRMLFPVPAQGGSGWGQEGGSAMAGGGSSGRQVPGSSELVLAFPMDGDDACEDCKVFAYLPVYSAGLRFVVHADFELVASRQLLRHDSAWNQLLRSNVAKAFVAAMTSPFTAPPRTSAGPETSPQAPGLEAAGAGAGAVGGRWRGALHKYLPVEREITCEFWKTIASEIRDLLKGEECITTEDGRQRRPSEVLLRSTNIPPSLLSNADLYSATGFEFARVGTRGCGGRGSSDGGRSLDGGVGGEAGREGEEEFEELLKLGCRKASVSVLLDCLESGKMAPPLIQRPQKWFWLLDASLLT